MILAQPQHVVEASHRVCCFVMSALELGFKKGLPKRYLCFWLLSFQRLCSGKTQWEKRINSTFEEFVVIKHRHKMTSVRKQSSQAVHRLPKPSQGHHVSRKLVTFFMEYCNKLENLLYKSKGGTKS